MALIFFSVFHDYVSSLYFPGKYAQVTNHPENDGCINAVLLVWWDWRPSLCVWFWCVGVAGEIKWLSAKIKSSHFVSLLCVKNSGVIYILVKLWVQYYFTHCESRYLPLVVLGSNDQCSTNYNSPLPRLAWYNPMWLTALEAPTNWLTTHPHNKVWCLCVHVPQGEFKPLHHVCGSGILQPFEISWFNPSCVVTKFKESGHVLKIYLGCFWMAITFSGYVPRYIFCTCPFSLNFGSNTTIWCWNYMHTLSQFTHTKWQVFQWPDLLTE